MALAISASGGSLAISFPTQPGYSYQVEYTTNLTDAVWIPLGSATVGNGSVQSVLNAIGAGSRFYRVQIQ
jgi:hypothetical protein